jgi:hypothetical protein
VRDEAIERGIKFLTQDVDEKVVADFFAGMDEDYFVTFLPEEIATHIRMSAGLDSRHRVLVHVTPGHLLPASSTSSSSVSIISPNFRFSAV